MAEDTADQELPVRVGRPQVDFGDLDKTKFIGLVEAGMGRWLALKECGFKNYRSLARALRSDPDFRAEVELVERANEDAAKLTIYAAMVNSQSTDLAKEFLSVTWKVRAMAEANRSRKKAEDLAEREMKLREGGKDDVGEIDLSKLSTEELVAWRALMAKASRKARDPNDPTP